MMVNSNLFNGDNCDKILTWRESRLGFIVRSVVATNTGIVIKYQGLMWVVAIKENHGLTPGTFSFVVTIQA